MHLSLLLMCKLHRICHSLQWWYDYWPQTDHTAQAPSDRPAESGMCGKNGIAYVFWSEALHELNSQMWGSHLACLECLLQSEFLGVCDTLVGNDVVMGVRELLRGQKQRLRGKFVGFGDRNCKLGCLKTRHSNPVSLSFPIHKMGTIRPPQYLQVIKEHYF